MTKYPELFAALAAPFAPHEVKVRTQAGIELHYITARHVMNRLDDVLGPEAWWDEYIPGENSVLCRLTIRLPDGTTLTKADAGGYAGMKDQGDDEKSGFSDSFKRAAVKFGVARYLYRDGVPGFVRDLRPAPAPALAAAPMKERDERSCWQLISDQAARTNDAWFAMPGKADTAMITDAKTAAGRLLWLAWDRKKTTYEPTAGTGTQDVVREMERVYKEHRQWVRGELKAYLADTLAEATRKAESRGVTA